MEHLLDVQNLQTSFFTKAGVVKAVDGISYSIAPNETVGLVGESGCGKTVTGFSILGLLSPPGKVTGGKVFLGETELTSLAEREMQKIRGSKIAMIFQEPMTALNPVVRVGDQIVEQIRAHEPDVSKAEARKRAIDLFELVGIPAPRQRIDDYPHQLSGGMRQRAMISMALSCNPSLLIADEPTTALDVTIQAQILDLLKNLQDRFGMSIQFITHDLGVISEIADRVIVMYAGKIVEEADRETIFENPKHPYTVGLFQSIPRIDETKTRLNAIPGSVPSLLELPKGCRYQNRCPRAIDTCKLTEPPLSGLTGDHQLACHNPY
jgi:oligopeptide/dipeptide ABC transporter ATP-binding protein